MDYKVGDKVTVRSDLQVNFHYGHMFCIEEMLPYLGKTGTVTSIYQNGELKLSVDDSWWLWSPDMVVPASEAVVQEQDVINKPDHYRQGEIETIDIIRMSLTKEEYIGFLKGNILKYQLRAPFKHETPDEDYAKAKRYFDVLEATK